MAKDKNPPAATAQQPAQRQAAAVDETPPTPRPAAPAAAAPAGRRATGRWVAIDPVTMTVNGERALVRAGSLLPQDADQETIDTLHKRGRIKPHVG